MSKRTFGHVLVLPSRRLMRPTAEDDFVKTTNPLKFVPKKFFFTKSLFKRKKFSHTFEGRRHYALSSYLLPFLKALSLTSAVQTMAFQSKTT